MHIIFQENFGHALPMRQLHPLRVIRKDNELDEALNPMMKKFVVNNINPDTCQRALVISAIDTNRLRLTNSPREEISLTRHDILFIEHAGHNETRNEKINSIVKGEIAKKFNPDWIMIIDDDVILSKGFFDNFIDISRFLSLSISQPAHRMHSFSSYLLTQRVGKSIARKTNFVEIGPVVAISKQLHKSVFPLPETRWGWGIDFIWADRARKAGWALGVIDGTPIEHLRPVGPMGHFAEAMNEATDLLDQYSIDITRHEILKLGKIAIGW